MKFPKILSSTNISLKKSHLLPFGCAAFMKYDDKLGRSCELYWAFGREEEDPIVCHYHHEEHIFEPIEKDIATYWANGKEARIALNDVTFFMNPYLKAKILNKKGLFEEAINRLEISINLFGDYPDSWLLYAQVLHKVNKLDLSYKALIQSIKANWAFGFDFSKVIVHLQNITNIIDNEPIIKHKNNLFYFNTNTKKYILNEEIWCQCIKQYEQQGDLVSAFKLEQNLLYSTQNTSEKFESKYALHFPNRIYSF